MLKTNLNKRLFIDLLLISIVGFIISITIKKIFSNANDDIVFYCIYPTVYIVYFFIKSILLKK